MFSCTEVYPFDAAHSSEASLLQEALQIWLSINKEIERVLSIYLSVCLSVRVSVCVCPCVCACMRACLPVYLLLYSGLLTKRGARKKAMAAHFGFRLTAFQRKIINTLGIKRVNTVVNQLVYTT